MIERQVVNTLALREAITAIGGDALHNAVEQLYHLLDGAETRGIYAGNEEGYENGFEDGVASIDKPCSAYDEGFDHGFETGYENGLEHGRDAGQSEGFALGQSTARPEEIAEAAAKQEANEIDIIMPIYENNGDGEGEVTATTDDYVPMPNTSRFDNYYVKDAD